VELLLDVVEQPRGEGLMVTAVVVMVMPATVSRHGVTIVLLVVLVVLLLVLFASFLGTSLAVMLSCHTAVHG
jgi:uncharacterized membrane protein YobD (UPF0266 family)